MSRRARLVRRSAARRRPVLLLTSTKPLTAAERDEFVEQWRRHRVDRPQVPVLSFPVEPKRSRWPWRTRVLDTDVEG